jgi:plasmid replication initiation protein
MKNENVSMEKALLVDKIEEKSLVILSNAVIEARYKMSLNEQKLFLALVSLIEKNDSDLKQYSINVQSLREIFDISDISDISSDHIYEEVKKIATRVAERTLFIEDKVNKRWAKYPFFSVMEYANGFLYAEFNQKIKPLLLELKKEFTKFQLNEFKPFKSKYSIRIYQLLKQYALIGERTFEISELKAKLGIDTNKLKQFVNFKERVLNITQHELNDTPMAFDWEAIKEGRKFTKIRFVLKNKHGTVSDLESYPRNNQQQEKKTENECEENKLQIQKQIDLDLINNPDYKKIIGKLILLFPEKERTKNAEQMISNLLQNYNEDYITNQIEYTNNHKTKNYLAYLKKAADNDYASAERSELANKMKIEQLKQQLQNELEQIKNRQKHDIESQIFGEEKRIYKSYMDSLTKEQKEELWNEFKPKALDKEPGLKDLSLKFEVERLITAKIIEENQTLKDRLNDLRHLLEQNAAEEIEHKKEEFDEVIKSKKL